MDSIAGKNCVVATLSSNCMREVRRGFRVLFGLLARAGKFRMRADVCARFASETFDMQSRSRVCVVAVDVVSGHAKVI
jgi:hypothetical protein